jgi:hypothetical protein
MTGYIPLVTRVASEISREMGFRKLKAYPEVAGIKSIG